MISESYVGARLTFPSMQGHTQFLNSPDFKLIFDMIPAHQKAMNCTKVNIFFKSLLLLGQEASFQING